MHSELNMAHNIPSQTQTLKLFVLSDLDSDGVLAMHSSGGPLAMVTPLPTFDASPPSEPPIAVSTSSHSPPPDRATPPEDEGVAIGEHINAFLDPGEQAQFEADKRRIYK